MGIRITNTVSIPETEVSLIAIRAQGAGGQNVNKVASAIHLRFAIGASSLPQVYKERLLQLPDSRISDDGIIVIKAQQHRSQQKNREDALARLVVLIRSVSHTPRSRKATRPGKKAKMQRMDRKTRRGRLKSLRKKVTDSSS